MSEFKRLKVLAGTKKVTFGVDILALKLRGISACALVVFALSLLGSFLPAFAEEMVVLCPERISVGEPFLVTVYMESKPERVELSWLGETLSLDVQADGGHFVSAALLGTDILNSTLGEHELAIYAKASNGQLRVARSVKVIGKKFKEQRLSLPEKMVTPPKDVLDRITKEQKQVREVLATRSPKRLWELPFVRPVPGAVTSEYGLTRVLNGKPKNPHRGVDLRGAAGDPVKAVASGRVALAEEHYFAGKCIYLDHGNGVISVYMHLSRIGVAGGDLVEAGAVIGNVGSTGRVTGPHLHLGIGLQGRMVDPMPLLATPADHPGED
jgi:murein DD-endopeptidase MepM/ murein hydrolase activator NlpD